MDVSGSPEEITERAVDRAARGSPSRPPSTPVRLPQLPVSCKETTVTRLSVEMLAADAAEPITSAGHAQLGIAVLAGIAVIVLLITKFKLHAFLALTIGSLALGAVRRGAAGQGHHQLHHRARRHRRRRRRADRARRDPRQAARRLRRRRPDRRHDPREGERAGDALGDGADRLGDRAAALLRGRHRAADPGRAAGRQARQLLADADRHPGAGRPVRDARADPAAPRPAGRDRRGRAPTSASPWRSACSSPSRP